MGSDEDGLSQHGERYNNGMECISKIQDKHITPARMVTIGPFPVRVLFPVDPSVVPGVDSDGENDARKIPILWLKVLCFILWLKDKLVSLKLY